MSLSSGTATFCCTPQDTDKYYPGQIKADSDSQQTPKGQSIKSNMEKLVLNVFFRTNNGKAAGLPGIFFFPREIPRVVSCLIQFFQSYFLVKIYVDVKW